VIPLGGNVALLLSTQIFRIYDSCSYSPYGSCRNGRNTVSGRHFFLSPFPLVASILIVLDREPAFNTRADFRRGRLHFECRDSTRLHWRVSQHYTT